MSRFASAGTGFNYTGEASGTSWTLLDGNIGIVTNLFYDDVSGRLSQSKSEQLM